MRVVDVVSVVCGSYRAVVVAEVPGLVTYTACLSHIILQIADAHGVTPLMHASERAGVSPIITNILLEGGADPKVTCQKGCLALHVSARHGVTNIARILVSEAPHTLFDRTLQGDTPLFLAAYEGQWRTVSYLISVAHLHGETFVAQSTKECPLMAAVVQACLRRPSKHDAHPLSHGPSQHYGKVVEVLLGSGRGVLQRKYLASRSVRCVAILGGRVDILQQLLDVDGEKRRAQWAQSSFRCRSMLHYAAGYARLSCVNALLRAGADETAVDGKVRRPGNLVGSSAIEKLALLFPGISDFPAASKDPATISAIDRMLERGPAYRARSWAYPAFGETRVDASNQKRATRSETAEKEVSPLHVRIFRRQGRTRLPAKCFAAALNRCVCGERGRGRKGKMLDMTSLVFKVPVPLSNRHLKFACTACAGCSCSISYPVWWLLVNSYLEPGCAALAAALLSAAIHVATFGSGCRFTSNFSECGVFNVGQWLSGDRAMTMLLSTGCIEEPISPPRVSLF